MIKVASNKKHVWLTEFAHFQAAVLKPVPLVRSVDIRLMTHADVIFSIPLILKA